MRYKVKGLLQYSNKVIDRYLYDHVRRRHLIKLAGVEKKDLSILHENRTSRVNAGQILWMQNP
jgi:hypothetical protein